MEDLEFGSDDVAVEEDMFRIVDVELALLLGVLLLLNLVTNLGLD